MVMGPTTLSDGTHAFRGCVATLSDRVGVRSTHLGVRPQPCLESVQQGLYTLV